MQVLLLVPVWALSLVAPATLIVVPEQKLDAVGDCIEPSGKADELRGLRFLKSHSANTETAAGKLRITLQGEHVRIDNLRYGRAHGFYYSNLGDQVEPNDDLDIELRLARQKGRLVIYWKETYRHKIYRQGLFRVVDERVELICQGRGGLNSSD
jgi:hypothetical protein